MAVLRLRSVLAALVMLGGAALVQAQTVPANVDQARMTAADGEPGQWMGPGRTYGEQRYSPLDQINADNVTGLGLAWYADISVDRGVEASPLMIDGVLYNIEPWNVTVA